MKRAIVPAAVLAAILLTASASAQDFGIRDDATGGPRAGVKETAGSPAGQWITQSLEPCTVLVANTAGCLGPVDNHYWRVFDLDEDYGMSGAFCTTDVDYAIEFAVGDELVTTARVWCLDDGLPFVLDFLELAALAMQELPASVELEFFNVELAGCCDAGSQSMVVELVTTDCQETGGCVQMWMGSNDLGQTGPTYLSAPDCGIVDPVDIAAIGFPKVHLVMVVHGEDEGGTGGGSGDPCNPDAPNVPATTGVGAMLILLALLGGAAYFLRR